MCELNKILSSVEFWKFALPLFGAVVAWFVNEWRKRVADQYERKEENCKELLNALRGFYVGAENASELKQNFLTQLNIAWLYCPDDVIRKGYAFIDTVHANQESDDAKKEKAMGEFVSAIRADLLSRKLVKNTALSSEDFRHLGVK